MPTFRVATGQYAQVIMGRGHTGGVVNTAGYTAHFGPSLTGLILAPHLATGWADPSLWITAEQAVAGPAAQDIILPHITDADTLSTPTLTVGAITITLPHITDGDTLNPPVLTPGAVTITLPTISDADTLSPPTLTPGAITITLPAISDGDTLSAPTLTPGAVTITLPAISDTDTLHVPTLSPGPVSVTLPHITDADTLRAPTLTPGAVTVTLPTIEATSQLFVPEIVPVPRRSLDVPDRRPRPSRRSGVTARRQVHRLTITASVMVELRALHVIAQRDSDDDEAMLVLL